MTTECRDSFGCAVVLRCAWRDVMENGKKNKKKKNIAQQFRFADNGHKPPTTRITPNPPCTSHALAPVDTRQRPFLLCARTRSAQTSRPLSTQLPNLTFRLGSRLGLRPVDSYGCGNGSVAFTIFFACIPSACIPSTCIPSTTTVIVVPAIASTTATPSTTSTPVFTPRRSYSHVVVCSPATPSRAACAPALSARYSTTEGYSFRPLVIVGQSTEGSSA